MKRQLLTLLAAAAMVWAAAAATDPHPQRDNVRSAIRATVRILGGGLDAAGNFVMSESGSGVVIHSSGLVLSNYHVTHDSSGKRYPEIWAGLTDPENDSVPPNRAVRLAVVQEDPKADLVLLKIKPRSGAAAVEYPFLPLSAAGEPGYGDSISIVGFPVAGGRTVTVVRTDVVGLDEKEDWIKVEGSVMRGVSGGAAIDGKGRLVGIPTLVQEDQEIEMPFLGDDEVPMGTIRVRSVGFLRSVEGIRKFLAQVPAGQAEAGFAPLPPARYIQVTGGVIDKASGKPVPGATIGILVPSAANPAVHVERRELAAFAKSRFDGEFTSNKAVRAGKYIFKVVHPQYRTLIEEVDVRDGQSKFDIKLEREE